MKNSRSKIHFFTSSAMADVDAVRDTSPDLSSSDPEERWADSSCKTAEVASVDRSFAQVRRKGQSGLSLRSLATNRDRTAVVLIMTKLPYDTPSDQ